MSVFYPDILFERYFIIYPGNSHIIIVASFKRKSVILRPKRIYIRFLPHLTILNPFIVSVAKCPEHIPSVFPIIHV